VLLDDLMISSISAKELQKAEAEKEAGQIS
jgi:hypothetical protein